MTRASDDGSEGHLSSADESKKRKHTRRLKMACDQCRARKIKCDRVIPCKNCSTRRKAEPCRYSPEAQANAVTQTAEISNLRKQLSALKKDYQALQDRFEALSLKYDGENDQTNPSQRRPLSHIRTQPPSCEIPHSGRSSLHPYASAKVSQDIIRLPKTQKSISLIHPAPRAVDTWEYQDASAHPFSIFWDSTKRTTVLLSILPDKKEIFRCVAAFDNHLQSLGFPLGPSDRLGKDIDRFMSDLEANAEKYPAMLAFMFAVVTQGTWLLQDREKKVSKKVNRKQSGRKSDIYLSAAMHALSLSSYLNRPTLLSIETLILINGYLVNTGRFLDAYTLFGTTIRLAQAVGLHRDPLDLPNSPNERECNKRRSIWWWLLHADTTFSFTLGRPLGISVYGDCHPPTTFSDVHSAASFDLSTILADFTTLCRDILEADNLTNLQIDQFTEALSNFSFELPSCLRFSPQWLEPQFARPHWSIGVQAIRLCVQINTYLVLLNRRWSENPRAHAAQVDNVHDCSVSGSHDSVAYTRVITSCRAILQAFRYLRNYFPEASIDWSIFQCAYNAAVIIGISLVQTRDFNVDDISLISDLYSAFEDMGDTDLSHGLPPGLPVKGQQVLRTFLTPSFKEAQTGRLCFPLSFGGERVLGGHGMILLEDPGLLDHYPDSDRFSPLDWSIMRIEGQSSGDNGEHEPEPDDSQPGMAILRPTDDQFSTTMSQAVLISSTSPSSLVDVETQKRQRESASLSPQPVTSKSKCKRRKMTSGNSMKPPTEKAVSSKASKTSKTGPGFTPAKLQRLWAESPKEPTPPAQSGDSSTTYGIPGAIDFGRLSAIHPLATEVSRSKRTAMPASADRPTSDHPAAGVHKPNTSVAMAQSVSEPVLYPPTSIPMTQSVSEPPMVYQHHAGHITGGPDPRTETAIPPGRVQNEPRQTFGGDLPTPEERVMASYAAGDTISKPASKSFTPRTQVDSIAQEQYNNMSHISSFNQPPSIDPATTLSMEAPITNWSQLLPMPPQNHMSITGLPPSQHQQYQIPSTYLSPLATPNHQETPQVLPVTTGTFYPMLTGGQPSYFNAGTQAYLPGLHSHLMGTYGMGVSEG